MFDPQIGTIYDLEDVAPMLKRYGEVCLLWKKGYTATFKWFGDNSDRMEDLRERKRRINQVLNPTIELM